MCQRGGINPNTPNKAPNGATAMRQLESAVASPRLKASIFSAYRGFHPRLRAIATSVAESQRKQLAHLISPRTHLTTRTNVNRNPGTDVPPLAVARSGRYRFQRRHQLQIIRMLFHRTFVRSESLGEDELITVACSFPAMGDIALMGVDGPNYIITFVLRGRDCKSFNLRVSQEFVELFAAL